LSITAIVYSCAILFVVIIAAAFVLMRPKRAAAPLAEPGYGTIQVTAGSLSGKRFTIPGMGLLVGTDPEKCQVVVSEDTISPEHAWILPVHDRMVVIDRGSTNGTYVNSLDSPRVSKVGLEDGDRVYLGKKGAVILTYSSPQRKS